MFGTPRQLGRTCVASWQPAVWQQKASQAANLPFWLDRQWTRHDATSCRPLQCHAAWSPVPQIRQTKNSRGTNRELRRIPWHGNRRERERNLWCRLMHFDALCNFERPPYCCTKNSHSSMSNPHGVPEPADVLELMLPSLTQQTPCTCQGFFRESHVFWKKLEVMKEWSWGHQTHWTLRHWSGKRVVEIS